MSNFILSRLISFYGGLTLEVDFWIIVLSFSCHRSRSVGCWCRFDKFRTWRITSMTSSEDHAPITQQLELLLLAMLKLIIQIWLLLREKLRRLVSVILKSWSWLNLSFLIAMRFLFSIRLCFSNRSESRFLSRSQYQMKRSSIIASYSRRTRSLELGVAS